MLDFTPGSKSVVSVDWSAVKADLDNFKLYLFGQITTESGPKSLEACGASACAVTCTRAHKKAGSWLYVAGM